MVSRHNEAMKRHRRDSLNLLRCVYICSVLTSTGVCTLAQCNFKIVCTFLTNITKMCVHLLSTAVCIFARCPSAATADPATVTLVNILANIFVMA